MTSPASGTVLSPGVPVAKNEKATRDASGGALHARWADAGSRACHPDIGRNRSFLKSSWSRDRLDRMSNHVIGPDELLQPTPEVRAALDAHTRDGVIDIVGFFHEVRPECSIEHLNECLVRGHIMVNHARLEDGYFTIPSEGLRIVQVP